MEMEAKNPNPILNGINTGDYSYFKKTQISVKPIKFEYSV